MIYNIPAQHPELLEHSFFKIRRNLDIDNDSIQLVLDCNYQDSTDEEMYRLLLRCEGKYKAKYNLWNTKPLNMSIVKLY